MKFTIQTIAIVAALVDISVSSPVPPQSSCSGEFCADYDNQYWHWVPKRDISQRSPPIDTGCNLKGTDCPVTFASELKTRDAEAEAQFDRVCDPDMDPWCHPGGGKGQYKREAEAKADAQLGQTCPPWDEYCMWTKK